MSAAERAALAAGEPGSVRADVDGAGSALRLGAGPLHCARLSPKRRASTLVTRSGEPRPPLHDLVAAIGAVLNKAIKNQYRTGADDPFVVYDKEGERCPRRGCAGTITRIVQAGRSTFFCAVCQN